MTLGTHGTACQAHPRENGDENGREMQARHEERSYSGEQQGELAYLARNRTARETQIPFGNDRKRDNGAIYLAVILPKKGLIEFLKQHQADLSA